MEGGITFVDFSHANPKGGRVPARLLIPVGHGPFPALIIQHGSLSDLEALTDLGLTFARHGAVALLINDPYSRPGYWNPSGIMGTPWPFYTERDLEFKIQLIVDLQRAVDLLTARPDVDPNRIAYYGVSFGAATGGLLAGVEDRIEAYVLQVADGGLVEHTSDPGSDGKPVHFSETWAALMWPSEPIHFIGLAAPAELLFLNGIHDENVPPRDAIRYQIAASEPKTIRSYDADHALPMEAVTDAARWLQPHLGAHLLWFAPNYRPSAILLNRLFTIWIALTLACLLILQRAFRNHPELEAGDRLLWALAVVMLGPIGLSIYLYLFRPWWAGGPPAGPSGASRRVLSGGIYITTALTFGLLVSSFVAEVLHIDSQGLKLLVTYLLSLCAAWGLLLPVRKTYGISTFSHVLMTNLYWVVGIPMGNALAQIWNLPTLFDVRIWWVFSLCSSTVLALMTPLQNWLLRRGLAHSVDRIHVGPADSDFGKLSWIGATGMLVASYLLIAVGLLVVVWLSSGLSLDQLIQELA